MPLYDFTSHARRGDTQRCQPRRAIIVEGILIFADRALRDAMDIKVFVDADADTRFIRRLQRDVAERGRTMESVIEQYQGTVKPMHFEFVEPTKRYADLIIPVGGHNAVAVDLMLSLVRSLTASNARRPAGERRKMAPLEGLDMTSAQRRSVRVASAFVALAWCATATAQTKPWTQGKTPDGQPDLQGTWLNFDATPFETPVARSAPAPAAAGSTAATNVGPASEFADHNHQVSARRRSMVVDPPDGRVPGHEVGRGQARLRPGTHPRRAGTRDAVGALHHARPPRRHVPRRLQQRLPDHADPGLRGVRLRDDPRDTHRPDRRAAALGASIQQWNGEPRGRWEGDTLVVESTNYNSKGSIASSAATGRIRGIPQSASMKVTERFTRVDEKTIDYTRDD